MLSLLIPLIGRGENALSMGEAERSSLRGQVEPSEKGSSVRVKKVDPLQKEDFGLALFGGRRERSLLEGGREEGILGKEARCIRESLAMFLLLGGNKRRKNCWLVGGEGQEERGGNAHVP